MTTGPVQDLYLADLVDVALVRLAKSSSELDAVRTAWASFGQSLQRQLQRFLSLDASQVGSGHPRQCHDNAMTMP